MAALLEYQHLEQQTSEPPSASAISNSKTFKHLFSIDTPYQVCSQALKVVSIQYRQNK